jgi:hypothetical protein
MLCGWGAVQKETNKLSRFPLERQDRLQVCSVNHTSGPLMGSSMIAKVSKHKQNCGLVGSISVLTPS